ncbi:hypothetical protein PVL29_020784 [Vitis rotundifolia]|uniref:ATPase AAA-type core domain-containing protein n=1 Tax=Vitis rotundifolia TaxID=103349 RepID=A0AA38YYA3_VITRO|nr:hypothetical protein PVL29_020784 [Vitis rotundifolia]
MVLFGKIEKAYPDAFNMMHQILEDDMSTDNKGRTVDFKSTLLIMTSNVDPKEQQNALEISQNAFHLSGRYSAKRFWNAQNILTRGILTPQ